jgi:SagB-type dehydrogenase family enzyme
MALRWVDRCINHSFNGSRCQPVGDVADGVDGDGVTVVVDARFLEARDTRQHMPLKRPSRRTIGTVIVVAVVSVLLDVVLGAVSIRRRDDDGGNERSETIGLPSPRTESDRSVEAAIANRRSRREYGDRALERDELGQVLWAAQGVTDRLDGFRAAPSAGALYPLELYVVVGSPGVEGLERGVYRYRPADHDLVRERTGDVQPQLSAAAVDQQFVADAAVDVVVCAADDRTTRKYGERGKRRYVPMEAGHAGENIYLQCEALGLSTVSVGAFGDDRVRSLVGAPADYRPLYIFPVGRRA